MHIYIIWQVPIPPSHSPSLLFPLSPPRPSLPPPHCRWLHPLSPLLPPPHPDTTASAIATATTAAIVFATSTITATATTTYNTIATFTIIADYSLVYCYCKYYCYYYVYYDCYCFCYQSSLFDETASSRSCSRNFKWWLKKTPFNKNGNNDILNLHNFLHIYTNFHDLFASTSKIGHLATLCIALNYTLNRMRVKVI